MVHPIDPQKGRKDLLKTFLLCVVAVLITRSFLFEPFKIPSSSMVPTLLIGDHIFVSKFNYGLSIPFTTIELTSWRQPARGEVIVFLNPRDESLHYVKRVIGIPGDRIEVRGHSVFVNGNEIPKQPIDSQNDAQYFTESIENHSYTVRHSSRGENEFLKTAVIDSVPEGQFFVMGDNRDESYDSRWFGFVPRKNIKGKALIVWLSLSQDPGHLNRVRWSRCGKWVQ